MSSLSFNSFFFVKWPKLLLFSKKQSSFCRYGGQPEIKRQVIAVGAHNTMQVEVYGLKLNVRDYTCPHSSVRLFRLDLKPSPKQ